jgi:hypothetical protein
LTGVNGRFYSPDFGEHLNFCDEGYSWLKVR